MRKNIKIRSEKKPIIPIIADSPGMSSSRFKINSDLVANWAINRANPMPGQGKKFGMSGNVLKL